MVSEIGITFLAKASVQSPSGAIVLNEKNMAVNSKDIETLWKQYSEEDASWNQGNHGSTEPRTIAGISGVALGPEEGGQ